MLNYDIYLWGPVIYIFNLKYWELVEAKKFKQFLLAFSIVIGVPTLEAKYFKFQELLLKQFESIRQIANSKSNSNNTSINFNNGTLEISKIKIELRHHSKHDYLKYVLPFDYNPESKAPKWNEFLEISLQDKNDQLILAEFLGYVFIKNEFKALNLEKALILLGDGGNGKSVVFDVVNAMLGRLNVSHFSINQITNENGYYRASFGRALLNYSSEIGKGFNIDELKKIISGEPITARLPYGEPFTLYNYPKLMFNANELPKDIEHNNAFFRRLIILSFDTIIPEDIKDTNLSKKIIENELPGIFNWAMKGLQRLITNGKFTYSKSSETILEGYKKESNTALLFIEEEEYQKSKFDFITLKDLYTDYVSYCINNGFQRLNKINFKKRLISTGFQIEKKNIGLVVFVEKKGFNN